MWWTNRGKYEVHGGVVRKYTACCWIFMIAEVSRYASAPSRSLTKIWGFNNPHEKWRKNINSIIHESIDFFLSPVIFNAKTIEQNHEQKNSELKRYQKCRVQSLKVRRRRTAESSLHQTIKYFVNETSSNSHLNGSRWVDCCSCDCVARVGAISTVQWVSRERMLRSNISANSWAWLASACFTYYHTIIILIILFGRSGRCKQQWDITWKIWWVLTLNTWGSMFFSSGNFIQFNFSWDWNLPRRAICFFLGYWISIRKVSFPFFYVFLLIQSHQY